MGCDGARGDAIARSKAGVGPHLFLNLYISTYVLYNQVPNLFPGNVGIVAHRSAKYGPFCTKGKQRRRESLGRFEINRVKAFFLLTPGG